MTDPDTATTPESATTGRNDRKTRQGVVVSDRGDKTVVVRVDRRIRHPLYHKAMIRSKKFHAHDEKNEFQVGDVVRIQETRPISKLKRWRVIGLVERPERI
jgi:small subunit ribosomal protein S17